MAADHYRRLGVTPAASTEEIREAYRALAGRLHPDRVVDGSGAEQALAERRMREINESWQVLRDPQRRREYDQSRLGGGRRAGGASAPGSGRRTAPTGVDDHDPGSGHDLDLDDDDDLVDVAPEVHGLAGALYRHLPWVVLLVVLAVIFVATAYAGRPDPATTPVPSTVPTGTCIDVSPGPVTTIVDCSGPHELVVVEEVPQGAVCPRGTEPRRFDDSGRVACVR